MTTRSALEITEVNDCLLSSIELSTVRKYLPAASISRFSLSGRSGSEIPAVGYLPSVIPRINTVSKGQPAAVQIGPT